MSDLSDYVGEGSGIDRAVPGRAVGLAVALGVGLSMLVWSSPPVQAMSEPGCGSGCEELDRLAFDHPAWGEVELVVGALGESPSSSCLFSVVDVRRQTVWERRATGCGYGAEIYRPAPDANGNLFIRYSTEQYEGITALRPTSDGIADFGSLPYLGGSFVESGRFEDSHLVDVGGDGSYEIVSRITPCEPSCAEGVAYFQTFSWDGTDFVAELCTLDGPAVPLRASPESNAAVVGELPGGVCGIGTTYTQGYYSGWTPVAYNGTIGWAPTNTFELPPTYPPPNLAPWTESWEDEYEYDPHGPGIESDTPVGGGSVEVSDALVGALPLTAGASGLVVAELQQLLLDAGISVGPDGADGHYGADTARGVAMLHDEAFSMGTPWEPGLLGVLNHDALALLLEAVEANVPVTDGGPCATPREVIGAVPDDWGPVRVLDIRCSSGWMTGYLREYGWADSTWVFFTVEGTTPTLVDGVYAQNGCEIFGVPAEGWVFLCGEPPAGPVVPLNPTCRSFSYNDRYPIRACNEGAPVVVIQSALFYRGWHVDIDGYFGSDTERAVRSFQYERGLEVDGYVGPITWAALLTGPVSFAPGDPWYAGFMLVSNGYDANGNGIIDPDELAR